MLTPANSDLYKVNEPSDAEGPMGTCMACHQVYGIACLTCSGPLLSDCDTCQDGWFFDSANNNGDGGCAPCHANCDTCNGGDYNECLTCSYARDANMMHDGVARVDTFHAGDGLDINAGEITCVTECSPEIYNTWNDLTTMMCT